MNATVREIVRDVVAEVAPDEMSLLDGLDSLSDDRVAAVLNRRKGGEDPLGFGVTEVTALLTPVAWLVVNEVAGYGTRSVVEGLARRVKSALRRLFRRPLPPRTVAPLSQDQYENVHRRILEQAAAAGIDESTARTLADAVISRLARTELTAPGTPGKEGPDDPADAARS
jgi:hypothetical protein